jgi:MSHA biogenesis protein MshL
MLLCLVFLGGCSSNNQEMPSLSRGHIVPPPQVMGNIPPPVSHSHQPVLPEETFAGSAYEELYTISVADFSVRGLLYSLAKNAKLNVDISPEISGIVTLNVIEQTLPRVLERIAQMANLRFEMEGPTLVVIPDSPYIHTYQINYLNIDRKMVSNLRLSSQIASAGSGVATSDSNDNSSGFSREGRSNIMVDNYSENNFWSQLESNVRAIVGNGPGEEESKNTKKFISSVEKDLAMERQFASGTADFSASESNTAKKSDEAPLVIVNQQSGLVTVRATSRQQNEIQLFLDQLMAGARRQLRIEATILEVRLDKTHERGIDWTAFRDVAANRSASYDVIGSNTSTTLARVVTTEDPIASLSLTNPIAGAANISGVFHNVNAAVKLLDKFGDVRVLSSPKLVTLNNQISVLKVVDNLVYFTLEKNERDSNSTLITTYTSNVRTVPVGLVMSVLPQISPNGQISLIVRPTITRVVDFVSDPNPDLAARNVVSRIPQIQVREMESMLSVQSGQTAAIGGLMTSVTNNSNGSIPGISEVPFFGNLFKHKKNSVTNIELVIFLKPTAIHSDLDLMENQELELLNTFLNSGKTGQKRRVVNIGPKL